MQLAHWISRTEINWLAPLIPPWMGMWFAVFATYETIIAQLLAAVLVVGSYFAARNWRAAPSAERAELVRAAEPEAMVGRLETVP
jgi:high-affinity iron transporter